MSRAVSIMVVVGALGVGMTTAHADSGTYHRCLFDDGGKADVYISGSGRDVTFDVQGARFAVHAQGGRFHLRAGQRTYVFDPRWGTPPAELTITTANERRVVRCTEP